MIRSRRFSPVIFSYAILLALLAGIPAQAADKALDGVIPKAQKPITLDGDLGDWQGAFVTPVHVGHPDFVDRGGQFLFLWDDKNLYVGLRCLDRKPAHSGNENQLWNGDAVEFYLDARRGDQLGAKEFGPGTLHMFWTPLTGTDFKPRLAVRDLPAFRDFKLQGAEVVGKKTSWGYTAEFKLPWANFPAFKPKAGERLGIDCELCSSDGGSRVDRTFVYSSPASVGSPSAFGRVKLVDKLTTAELRNYGRALLPLAVTKSANYSWLHSTVCLSPTIENAVAKVEGKILDPAGKVRKTMTGTQWTLGNSGFLMWSGGCEFFDLPAGNYTVEVTAHGRDGKALVKRTAKVLHGDPSATK
jgi:hypothetical protein